MMRSICSGFMFRTRPNGTLRGFYGQLVAMVVRPGNDHPRRFYYAARSRLALAGQPPRDAASSRNGCCIREQPANPYVAAKHFRIGYHPFLAGTVLLFAGVEVQGARANLMENPSRDFPEAMILASGVVFVLFVFGSLAVATIIPIKELSLTAGIMQAYKASLEMFHIGWLVPVALPFSRSAFSAKSSRGLAVQAARFYRPQRMEKSRTGSRKPTTTERQRSFFFFKQLSYQCSAHSICRRPRSIRGP